MDQSSVVDHRSGFSEVGVQIPLRASVIKLGVMRYMKQSALILTTNSVNLNQRHVLNMMKTCPHHLQKCECFFINSSKCSQIASLN